MSAIMPYIAQSVLPARTPSEAAAAPWTSGIPSTSMLIETAGSSDERFERDRHLADW
jgi:hypothetical protein